MSSVLYILVLVLVFAQIFLPKNWGFFPIIIAALHTGNVEILPELTPVRIIIIFGLVRIIFTGKFPYNSKNKLDLLFLLFSVLALISAFFHSQSEYNPYYARAGLVLNVFGTYLYARSYITDIETFTNLGKAVVLALIPLAFLMLFEHFTQRNLYSAISAANDFSVVRDGRVRAQGPFRHSILAGTAGASSLPIIAALYFTNRSFVYFGIACATAITFASSSSGPLMTFAFSTLSILFWTKRRLVMRYYKHFFVFLVLLHIVSSRGIWYLMARIDLVGGSTGYHRARLIDSALAHIDRWWLAGTDYTRDWMPFAAPWSENHVDITNYYISMAVTGGLPLLITFFSIIYISIKRIGANMLFFQASTLNYEYIFWCCGCCLLAHSVTFVSVTYFDQMFALFYVLIGAVSSLTEMGTNMKIRSTQKQ